MAPLISSTILEDLHELVASFCAKVSPVSTVAEAEELALQARQVVGEMVFDISLSAITARSGYKCSSLPCTCGSTRRFLGYRNRWIKSLCGEVQIERPYYHCSGRAHGAGRKQDPQPWDLEQGLTRLIGTPRFKACVCRVMGVTPYTDGVGLISDLCNVQIEESTAEAIVLEVGPRIRAVEQKRVDEVKLRIERATQERLMEDISERVAVEPLALRPVVGDRIYFGVDAATAHINGDWHNVQHGVVFNVKKDKDDRDTLLQREYVAGQMSMETLGWRMRTLGEMWNARAYLERIFLADGAPCNWGIAATYFPGAITILDFFHASEHLWELSRVLYRQDDVKQKALGERWVAQRLQSLKRDGPKPLLRSLKRRSAKTSKQREALRKELNYFKVNADRMKYPEHVAAGRMIGSGPVEAACKSVSGVRIKGPGMRWSTAGVDGILAIRTTILNGNAGQLTEFARAA